MNSIAHWLGEASFDDKHSPRDHLLTAVITLGEGYHNFHHQFPADYRNGVRWYDYDPTKWFIAACARFGLARDLRVVSTDVIEMGALSMALKRLKKTQDDISWPPTPDELPVVSWETCEHYSVHCASPVFLTIISLTRITRWRWPCFSILSLVYLVGCISHPDPQSNLNHATVRSFLCRGSYMTYQTLSTSIQEDGRYWKML